VASYNLYEKNFKQDRGEDGNLKKKKGKLRSPIELPYASREMLMGVPEIFNLHGTTGRKNKLENS